MQILLVAVGSYGDVLPILALGVELIRRGHDVALAAAAPFAALAARVDVPFHSLGTVEAYRRVVEREDLWHPSRGVSALFEHVAEVAEQTYDWIVQRSQSRRTLVVASSLSLGARVAQDKLGLPVVTVHATPFLVESRYASPLLPRLGLAPLRFRHWLGRGVERYVIGPAALPSLNAFRARLGLRPVLRLRHWWNSPSKVLLMFPEWFAPPQPDWLSQAVQTGFPLADRLGDAQGLSPDLAAFLAQGPAPLVFTYGSAMRQERRFYEVAVAVCARMKRRGVLLARHRDQVPADLPDDVIHVTYSPLSELLPFSAALVHHGGIGTVSQALAAGVPQLIVPLAFDQFDEGERVGRLRVGATLSRRRFKPARAARYLTRLIASPETQRRCRDIRRRTAQEDGISSACDQIEAMMA